MEQPDFGTNLLVGDSTVMLLVLAPTATGFRVFKDTWANDEKRKPVDLARDTPWVVFTRIP